MNKAETQSAKLLGTISELEHQVEIEKAHFKEGYHRLIESMKPVNLVRIAFEKFKESPKLRAKAFASVVGIAFAIIAKKVISKKFHEPPTRKENERVTQASRIITPVSKVLKPILGMVAAHLLNTQKRKQYEQHS